MQNKCTPLHTAAKDGNDELVQILLDHNASVTAVSKVMQLLKGTNVWTTDPNRIDVYFEKTVR